MIFPLYPLLDPNVCQYFPKKSTSISCDEQTGKELVMQTTSGTGQRRFFYTSGFLNSRKHEERILFIYSSLSQVLSEKKLPQ